jgi:hypothetical protein
MTPNAPGPLVAAAIPNTPNPTPSVPAASVMTVSMTAAVKTHGVAGAAIAAIRTVSDCESRTPESNGNQTHETSQECSLPMHDEIPIDDAWFGTSLRREVPQTRPPFAVVPSNPRAVSRHLYDTGVR